MPAPGPSYTIVSVTYAANGGRYLVVRKAGGQLRKVWVPAGRSSGPDLEVLAAGMLEQWRPRPPWQATGR